MSKKIYIRIDGKGNLIPGSAIKRNQKPKIGKWKEVEPTNVCCFDSTTLTSTPEDTVPGDYVVEFQCDASAVATFSVTVDEGSSLQGALNQKLSFLGQFSEVDGDIQVKVPADFITALGCSGTLTLEITQA